MVANRGHSGVPPERPIPDLPIERPNFSLLFGPGVSGTSGSSTPMASSQAAAEKGAQNSQSTQIQQGTQPAPIGPEGVLHPRGEKTGVRTQIGGEDVDVTDKLTMTWVSGLWLRCAFVRIVRWVRRDIRLR
jgi:N-acyl-phosphatidylethanolamine-hydrolysing phospholipase D